jgi:hypothetical protein
MKQISKNRNFKFSLINDQITDLCRLNIFSVKEIGDFFRLGEIGDSFRLEKELGIFSG